jgi:hypothetical protein
VKLAFERSQLLDYFQRRIVICSFLPTLLRKKFNLLSSPFQALHGGLHSTEPLHPGSVFVVKIWETSRYSKTQPRNSSRTVHVIHGHTPASDRYFASFRFLQQRTGIGLRVSEAMMPMGVECRTRARGSQVLFY